MTTNNECFIIEKKEDYMIIMMGCGVGYFLMGYLITSCLFEISNKIQIYFQNNQELIR